MGFPMAAMSAEGVASYEPIASGKTYTFSVNLLSGLLLQPKWIWLHAMPLDISLELQDGAKCFAEYSGSEALTTDYTISNPVILADLTTVSVDLTNAFTNHINAEHPLDYYIQCIDCVEHAVPDASLWSVNQARAYSQLNTLMAVMVLSLIHISEPTRPY